MAETQLYIASPLTFDLPTLAASLESVLQVGGVSAFLLQMEGADDTAWIAAINALMPMVQETETAFILNDRADLALKMDADGVHLASSQSMKISDARKLLGEDRIVGVSCFYNRHRAMVAAEEDASYVSFGPFFGTNLEPEKSATTDLINWWQETMETPCVAYGGITPQNAGAIVKAGADFICASTAVWTHPKGAAAAIGEFNDLLA